MSISFSGADIATGGFEILRSNLGIFRINLSSAIRQEAQTRGSITLTFVIAGAGGLLNSIEITVIQATGSALGAETTISPLTDGAVSATLPVTANGITALVFARHIQAIQSVSIGAPTELGGWIAEGSRLPSGRLGVSPAREEYHSVSGLFLGVSTPPMSEEVELLIRGIEGSAMRSAGVELIDALSYGEVDFFIESPIPGRSSFRAWAAGDIGQPQLRHGDQFDWDLSLRVAADD